MDQGTSGKTGEGFLGFERKEGKEEEGSSMRVVIIPGLVELRIKVDPIKKMTREGLPYIVMPWMFAPWPEAKSKGIIEIEIKGVTLRALLKELSDLYKKANVDFEPINPRTNDVDFDYEILVNGKIYVGLTQGLDTKLRKGNEVAIKMNWRWDG
jgi:molybdopterin converting factor small subunit